MNIAQARQQFGAGTSCWSNKSTLPKRKSQRMILGGTPADQRATNTLAEIGIAAKTGIERRTRKEIGTGMVTKVEAGGTQAGNAGGAADLAQERGEAVEATGGAGGIDLQNPKEGDLSRQFLQGLLGLGDISDFLVSAGFAVSWPISLQGDQHPAD